MGWACPLINVYCFHCITNPSEFHDIIATYQYVMRSYHYAINIAVLEFFAFIVLMGCIVKKKPKHLLGSQLSSKHKECTLPLFFSFFRLTAAYTIEVKCRAFRARFVWLSTERELCWIPFLSSCFNQCELVPCCISWEVILVPLLYADDFGYFSLV